MRRPARRARGFTLVELLIAGLMSALVLLAIYFVFIANTTQYYRQEQIVQMQESMRFAVELLKNDLRNAGRLTIVRGDGPGRDPRLCAERLGVRAIRLYENEQGTPAALTRYGNGLFPDRARLLVDAGGAVMFRTRNVTPDVIELAAANEQPTAEARAIAASPERLRAQFRPGLFLSISSATNAFDMVAIEDVAFANGGSTITLDTAVCGDVRMATCGQSCLVSTAQLVEYVVEENELEPDRTDLLRRVIDARRAAEDARGADVALDGLTLTVAEYVVDLQIWGLDRVAATTRMGDERNVDPDRPDARGRDAFERIQSVRALGVLLAARTPREDESFVVAPDRAVAAGDRLAAERAWFDVDDTPGTGLARVATLKAQVEATNLYRGELDVVE